MSTHEKKNTRFHFEPTIEQIWLAVPLLLSFTLLCLDPLREGDLWWHLQVGEEIVTQGRIPTHDAFSFTAQGLPYFVGHSWLSDSLFYLLDRLGGLSALVTLQALVGVAVVGSTIWESRRRCVSSRATATLVLIGWVGLYPFSTARPQIFSFLGFVLFTAFLSEYVNRQHQHLYLLPLIMLLWVNLHNGWVVGLIQWALAMGVVGAKTLMGESPFGRFRPLLFWGVLTALATLVNPSGVEVYRHLLTVGGNAVNQQFVSEWQPLTVTNRLSWPFFILLGLFVGTLAYSRKRPAFYDLLTVGMFAVLTLRYLRFLPFGLLALVPLIAEMASDMDWRISFAPLVGLSKQQGAMKPTNLNRAILLVLTLPALISIPLLRLPLTGQAETSLIDPYFPIHSADFLAGHAAAGARLFSLPEWGGYLIWRLYPQVTIFTDGRVELYPPSTWQAYLQIISASPEGLKLLDDYQINYLLLSKERQGQLAFAASSAGWQRVFEDEVAWVFARATPQP